MQNKTETALNNDVSQNAPVKPCAKDFRVFQCWHSSLTICKKLNLPIHALFEKLPKHIGLNFGIYAYRHFSQRKTAERTYPHNKPREKSKAPLVPIKRDKHLERVCALLQDKNYTELETFIAKLPALPSANDILNEIAKHHLPLVWLAFINNKPLLSQCRIKTLELFVQLNRFHIKQPPSYDSRAPRSFLPIMFECDIFYKQLSRPWWPVWAQEDPVFLDYLIHNDPPGLYRLDPSSISKLMKPFAHDPYTLITPILNALHLPQYQQWAKDCLITILSMQYVDIANLNLEIELIDFDLRHIKTLLKAQPEYAKPLTIHLIAICQTLGIEPHKIRKAKEMLCEVFRYSETARLFFSTQTDYLPLLSKHKLIEIVRSDPVCAESALKSMHCCALLGINFYEPFIHKRFNADNYISLGDYHCQEKNNPALAEQYYVLAIKYKPAIAMHRLFKLFVKTDIHRAASWFYAVLSDPQELPPAHVSHMIRDFLYAYQAQWPNNMQAVTQEIQKLTQHIPLDSDLLYLMSMYQHPTPEVGKITIVKEDSDEERERESLLNSLTFGRSS